MRVLVVKHDIRTATLTAIVEDREGRVPIDLQWEARDPAVPVTWEVGLQAELDAYRSPRQPFPFPLR